MKQSNEGVFNHVNYNHDLFKERYAVFQALDKVLSECFSAPEKHWREFAVELDSVHGKSYFLFSDETHEFIKRFREAVINYKYNYLPSKNGETIEKQDRAREFLTELMSGQNFAKNFPELKIDTY